MTMSIRIKNLGPSPYAAEVRRGDVPHITVQPGESVSLYGWKDGGDISIRETAATPIELDDEAEARGFTSLHTLDENGFPAGGNSSGVGFDIDWQNGPLGRGAERLEPNGAFVENVIAAAKDRIEFYQTGSEGRFACDENARAIAALDLALMALHERTAKREARQVEGTHTA